MYYIEPSRLYFEVHEAKLLGLQTIEIPLNVVRDTAKGNHLFYIEALAHAMHLAKTKTDEPIGGRIPAIRAIRMTYSDMDLRTAKKALETALAVHGYDFNPKEMPNNESSMS